MTTTLAPAVDLASLYRLYHRGQDMPEGYDWQQAIYGDARHALWNRVPGLTQLRRRVLHLRYWEGLSVLATAAYLGVSEEYAGALERLAVAELHRYLAVGGR